MEVLVITKQEAIKLSLIKWEYIVNNDGSIGGLTDHHPELDNLLGLCGLCEYYEDLAILSNISDEFSLNRKTKCSFCDLAKLNTSCFDDDSYFQIWNRHRTKENAQDVLNLIKQIK